MITTFKHMVRVKKSNNSVKKRTHNINNDRRNAALLSESVTTSLDTSGHNATDDTFFFGRANQNGIFFNLRY